MSTATGVAVELAVAQEESIPYFLLAGFSSGSTSPTTARRGDKRYKWT